MYLDNILSNHIIKCPKIQTTKNTRIKEPPRKDVAQNVVDGKFRLKKRQNAFPIKKQSTICNKNYML
jgi:hypothetical protein